MTVEQAVAALKAGQLVVIPTETVYGLAAQALHAVAVAKIFEAKGRPAENPLIVHVASLDQLRLVVSGEPDLTLAERFWPGPLTLVWRKSDQLPPIVTAGLETVAVRMPSHPVARKIIELAGPLAAPSANRFTRLSPTRPEDVDPEILGMSAGIVDGGECEVGIESTIVDLSAGKPRVLRLGGVSLSEVRTVAPAVEIAEKTDVPSAPGQYPKHYAPRARLVLRKPGPAESGLVFGGPASSLQIQMPNEPQAYAHLLYATLHRLDGETDVVFVEPVPETEEWAAINDRLRRASHENDS